MTERTRRKTRVGVVVSDARDKTVTVEVVSSKMHGRYGKTMKHRSRFHASSSSSATCLSTPCHSRWPVNEAMVEFRSPSPTPRSTSSRQ